MTAFSLAFAAHAVHRHGGQERAAAEILTRVARHVPVTVLAEECELGPDVARFEPIAMGRGPSLLRAAAFQRAVARAERRVGATLLNSIGAAARDADVITAQFCQAAFTARFGGLRGGTGARRRWQQFAQSRFTAHERHAYAHPRLKRVIAVSHGTARELAEHYGVPGSIMRVVPNGVDHATFRPARDAAEKQALRDELGLPRDQCIALFVGGDWARKGLDAAMAAVAPLHDVLFVIVGHGPIAEYERRAQELGARERVRFAGFSQRTQDWYAAADLFLFPSHYEAFSLVTLEAAAAGLPIVCHRINGTEELITEGENGNLVPHGADALRTALTTLRDDSALRARMSTAAVQHSQRYAWDTVADAYLAVLAEAARA
ncbi:MAG: glycosyltransferase family 4 protein [Gemmatimonadaceae bacterium]|nr:glycosyltransferase family 4 protein [Gemmatimonadaceae bacterium]